MEEKTEKMVKEEIAAYKKEEERLILTYKLIQAVVFAIAIVGIIVNWRIAVVATAWMLWNTIVYERGCQENVVDECEQDGYPGDGLRAMFKSWTTFAILAAVGLWLMYKYIPD